VSPNLAGALLMTGSMAFFTLNDTLIKLIGQDLPLFQVIALRGALATALIWALARALGKLSFRMGTRDRMLVGVRCLTELSTTYFFLTALLLMPLANITAILQMLPLTVTLAAAIIFREAVGWRRLSAILVGFCGMLLIVRPGPDGFSDGAIYALLAVLSITVRDLCARAMSSQVQSLTVTLLTSAVVTVAAGLAAVSEPWVPVTGIQAGMIVVAALLIGGGYLFSVMVMRVGDVAFTSTFRYSGLLWALLLGWLVFGDWPGPVTMAGAVLVVSAGAFTLYRERAQARAKS
jgi:S-adenosylmethionine uptake transporter